MNMYAATCFKNNITSLYVLISFLFKPSFEKSFLSTFVSVKSLTSVMLISTLE